MKKLLIINDADNFGGTDSYTRQLVRWLAEKKTPYELYVKCSRLSDWPMKNTKGLYGIFIKPISSYNQNYRFKRLVQIILLPITLMALFFDYCRLITKKKCLYFFINGGIPGSLHQVLLAFFLSLSGRKVIFQSHNFSSKGRFSDIQIYFLAQSKNIKFLTVSNSCAADIALKVGKHVSVVYNGTVIPKKFNRIPSPNIRIGLVCGPHSNKGIDLFLHLSKYYVDDERFVFNLNTFGSGLRNEVLDDIRSNGKLINVIYDEHDTNKIYSQIDILLNLSSAYESFGLTVIEAGVRGIPVIVTPYGGPGEIVNYINTHAVKKCGIVLSELKLEGLVTSIEYMAAEYQSYDSSGYIEEKFSEHFSHIKLINFLEEII
jgi:glycosyltransferase involved in cell wall biosynthesis